MSGSSGLTQGKVPGSSGQSRADVKLKKVMFYWWSFWLFLVVLGLLLANWQWQRAGEKQALQKDLQEAAVLENPGQAPPAWAQVQLTGRFLGERTLWLDNRILEGRVGVAALTPLVTANDRWWLVERGFVATSADRSRLPRISTPKEEVVIQGRWQRLEGQGSLVYGANREGERLQSISLEPWQDLEGRVFAGVVHQQAGEGQLQPWWTPNQMPPERHLGYAVQWLLLAGLALTMAVIGQKRWLGENKNE
ncbi:SURF1 family protein [Marinospirillum sp.]|uniref:SURF1 family protein n=1 Tax=Marinospirillum sp. TaxID=2183934 RepID=UPI00287026EF|nr:SURF1 family protein [Marinospirillum sp.]MDR9467016.1 SURF1 family protein [Marinospirillum sp.]